MKSGVLHSIQRKKQYHVPQCRHSPLYVLYGLFPGNFENYGPEGSLSSEPSRLESVSEYALKLGTESVGRTTVSDIRLVRVLGRLVGKHQLDLWGDAG